MMTQERDYEDALRRALTAAAESIEPAGDGLQRIRHRLASPRSPRSVLSGCAEWLGLHGTRFLVRLEPGLEAGRTALRRSGPLLALVSFLRRLLSPKAARRAGGHRGPSGSPGRLGPAGAWLKPVFAVSAAVAIVVVGVVILNHEGQTLIGPSSSVSTSSPSSGLGGGGTTANSKRWKLPLGVKTAPAGSAAQNPRPKSALPVVACTPTPSPSAAAAAPTGGATPTPTPTPTETATGPGTPSPTATGQPTPTATTSPATGGTTAATTAAVELPNDAGAPAIVECGKNS
jgi:hypothetical protein